MPEESFEEKTEAPSEKRRNEARQRGTVVKSTEINSVLVLLTGLFMLKFFGPWMMKEMGASMAELFRSIAATELDLQRIIAISTHSIIVMLRAMAPVVTGILIISVLANLMQVGFLFTMQPLVPNLSKINPLSGLGRLFSTHSWVELVKSVLKLIIIGIIAYWTLKAEFGRILVLADASVGTIMAYTAAASFKIILRVSLVLIILAILDYAYQRYEHEKRLRMTRQEVKEEHKQMEGDPKIKARVRSMQRELARRRMMQQVPKATVVVTNPTFIAIALRYEPAENDAPVVLAKGKRLIAERIREIAAANGIPIVEDKPLARGMYDKAVVGFPIPVEFFTAVAEVMAYVFRLKNRKAA